MNNDKENFEDRLEFWKETMEEHNWLKYLFYGVVAIGGIWVVGKASKVLADATRNFKELHKAVNG